MYKTKNYKVRELKEIYQEIDKISKVYSDTRKVFLADGDALSLPIEHLLKILQYLQESFPKLSRVSSYASTQNLLAKTQEELQLLKENKLTLIYYGIETGSDLILKSITKGLGQSEIIESLNRATQSGLKISAAVI